jgi:AcrR family transcriptional regulator
MSPRQQIGKRKRQEVTRQRGRDRRDAILQAAYDLLCQRPVEDIAFRDIADKAGIPEGSAYHFFANRFDIFSALAKKLSGLFIDAHRRSIPAAKRTSREALAAHFVDIGVRVYRRNPPALQLLIGGKTPPEVKQSDRINDRDVADVMYEVFTQHFELPDTAAVQDAFYYFIEITDLVLTLSMIEHGRITAAMIREAKRAGVAYLSTYY